MLRDRRLDLESRGALGLILTYPPDWQFSVEWLGRMGDCGRERVLRILRQLMDAGYCCRTTHRGPDGRMSATEYVFSDDPAAILPQSGKPTSENPPAGKPRAGNQPHTNIGKKQTSLSPLPPARGGRGRSERSGWARGWTKSAIAEVELLRASAPDALIVECVIDQVRGTLPPKRNADPVAFVRDVANRLRPFARDVLEATGAMLADTRTDYLPAGNEIEKIARTCERRLAVTAQKPEASAAASAVDPVLVSRFAEVRAAMRVDDKVLQDWIDKLIPISIAGKVLHLLAPTRFHASWVQSNYERELLEAARAVLDVTRVKFVDHQT